MYIAFEGCHNDIGDGYIFSQIKEDVLIIVMNCSVITLECLYGTTHSINKGPCTQVHPSLQKYYT